MVSQLQSRALKWLAGVAVFVLALAAPGGASSQEAGGRPVEISLLTMSPGDNLFTSFGHTAIRVRRLDDSRRDLVFDFGTYDASGADSGIKFIKGELEYWVSVSTMEQTMRWYGQAFSGITEQVLDLTPEQAQAVAAKLAVNARPENRSYAYHHFRDNCATRPRDILDAAFGGALRRATETASSGQSFRNLIDASLARAPYMRWVVFGLLNGQIDVPVSRWERMFLPSYLRYELDALRVPGPDGKPRSVVRSRKVLTGEERPADLPQPGPLAGILACLGLGLLGAAPLLLRKSGRQRAARIGAAIWLGVWGLLGGLYGVLMAFTWAVSPYPETKSNGNILVFHPALLLLLPLGILIGRASRRGERLTQWLLAVCMAGTLTAALMDLFDVTYQHLAGFAAAGTCALCGVLVWLWLEQREARG